MPAGTDRHLLAGGRRPAATEPVRRPDTSVPRPIAASLHPAVAVNPDASGSVGTPARFARPSAAHLPVVHDNRSAAEPAAAAHPRPAGDHGLVSLSPEPV